MPPTARITFTLAAALAALIFVLAACESPTPTPTPPPSPTPTPEPTPEPTAVERLAWFDAPTDVPHWIAWGALRRMAIDDEPLSQQIASLEWVIDGITAEEAGALDDLSWLLRENPDIAVTALNLPWMATNGDITPDDRRAIRAIRATADADAEFGAELAAYGWLPDGATTDEADALETLGEIVAPGFINQTATGIGAMRLDRSDGGALPSISPGRLEFALSLSQFSWMQDDVTSPESEFIANLSEFTETVGSHHAGAVNTIASYDWIQDEVTTEEIAGFQLLSNSLEYLLPERPDALDTVLAYEWLRDDIRVEEFDSIRALGRVIKQYGADTDEFIGALVARPWLRDGVQENEDRLLDEYNIHLSYERVPNTFVPSRLATYPWLDDGIADIELMFIDSAMNFYREFSPIAPETANAIIQNSGLDPDSLEDVMYAFWNFRRVFDVSDSVYDGDLTSDIARLPWLFDGLEGVEGWWLYEYAWLLRELDGENEELARSLLARPWARDGISAHEREWTHQYRRLLEETNEKNREDALKFADLAWFQEQIGFLAAGVMGRLASAAFHNESVVLEEDWPADGISESDLVLLIALLDAQARSEHQYRDLLEQNHIAQRTVTLPLAGDVELYVVRHTEFPDDDPTLNLMEQIMVQLEEFIGVPYPRNPSITLIIEPSTRAGETPQFGVAYAHLSHVLISAPRHNPGFHLAIFHEMSHMYWGGYTRAPVWWNEGAAGFLPDIARDALGHETLEERHNQLLWDTRNDCWHRGVANISEYYHLQETQPLVAQDRGVCVYAFGELFLMEMYLLLGRDATSAAMRQLYLDAQDSHWFDEVTDQRIYDAFRANTPDEKFDDFRKLFLRLHGGSRVDLSESAP
ncbi:MAG: hypothetical protein OXC55_02020 [Chloroflexi bacterium]|nr:hypothetical protein [Chloroflexota bacterium]